MEQIDDRTSSTGFLGLAYPPGEGHACFPNFLFGADLDPDEAIVLLGLIRARVMFPDAESIVPFPDCSLDQLASLCFGLPVRTVTRILERLQERGFVYSCGYPGEWDPSLIIVNFDERGDTAPANHFRSPIPQWGDRLDVFRRSQAHCEDMERRDRIDELAGMPYVDYLLTPEWKSRRLVEIERAGNRCELCNASGPFHVHHRTYERRGDEAPGDLVVLCPPCHKSFHDHRTLA